jgi:hypothetical protein
MHPKLISATALSVLLASPAAAADCTLANAIYDQPGTAYELHFKPVPAKRAGGTFANQFDIVDDNPEIEFHATTQWTSGASVPLTEIMLNCPAEPPSEDYQSCLIYSSQLYQLTGGRLGEMVSDSSSPPETILFPNLRTTLWYSKLRDIYGVFDMPGDVFRFKGCAG